MTPLEHENAAGEVEILQVFQLSLENDRSWETSPPFPTRESGMGDNIKLGRDFGVLRTE